MKKLMVIAAIAILAQGCACFSVKCDFKCMGETLKEKFKKDK